MEVSNRRTVPMIKSLKGERKIVCLTAYDAPFASYADASGVDLILVGDSVGNTVLGYQNTIMVTLPMMIHHTLAVRSAVHSALLVSDMPFGSYGSSVAQAVDSAVQLVRAGAEAVKLEGDFPEAVRAICAVGIPVMGHLGMTPQSLNQFGGFRQQAKVEKEAQELKAVAQRLEEAGAFGVVLELIPSKLSAEVTAQLKMVTIGIGAGPDCDGQIQVLHDVLGLTDHRFKHARRFAELGILAQEAISHYCEDVREDRFLRKPEG